MKQFELKSVVLALYLLLLRLIRLLSPIKDMFSLTVKSINHHERHINVPFNMASSWSTSTSPSPSTLSSSSSLSNLSSLSSLSWSSTSTMDEFIGTDSGVCMGSSEDLLKLFSSPTNAKPYSFSKMNLRQRSDQRKKIKAYPRTLPLLARTGNLSGRYPWVLHREYVDGRLVLKETRVERHEYFEAEREHGRLVLNLVELCTAPSEEPQYMEQRGKVGVVLPATT